MDIKEIRRLLRLIEDSAIEEFEMEREGVRIRIRKPSHSLTTIVEPVISESPERRPEGTTTLSPETETPTETSQNHFFKAPIVGTFYITPKPDVEPFVSGGSQVKKGSVLCIIEAMKIFNQIECDVDGEIVSILVENGQPVEYGQPLFEIRLTS